MIVDTKKSPPHRHKVEPWDHQGEWLDKTWAWEAFAFLWEMGCGKSKPMIDTIVKLYLSQEIDGALIVSDKGCYLGWAYDHIPRHMQDDIPRRLVTWRTVMSRAEQEAVESIKHARDDVLDIFVMNVEAFVSDRAMDAAAAFLMNHHAMMIVDESSSIKNPKALRTERMLTLGKLAEYRRIGSGTPMTNSPLDLFTQFQFLKKGCLGFTSYTAFKAYYADIIHVPGHSGRPFPKIMGYRNLDQLTESIQPISSRLLKSECLTLPEKVYETVYVEWTREQCDAYQSLKTLAMAEFGQGLVTATDALKLLGKLHQINCGHVKDDDGNTILIPSNRIGVLIEQVEKVSGKVVVWCHFQEDIRQVCAAFTKKFGEKSTVHFYGETGPDERQEALRRFRDDPECLYWVATPAAGGKGINELVVSSTAIYFSNSFNLAHRLQSEDRLHRPGQVNNVTIIDLVVPRTVDVKIVTAMQTKKDLAHQVLDKFRELLD